MRLFFLATILATGLVACVPEPIPTAMDAANLDAHVARNYGGDYNEFARTEWSQVQALVWEGDLQTLRTLHAQGVALDPTLSNRQDSLLYAAAKSDNMDIGRWLVGTAGVDPNNSNLLQHGATLREPKLVRAAVTFGDTQFYYPSCPNGPCVGPRGALTLQQNSWNFQDDEIEALLSSYISNPANAQRIALGEQRMRAEIAAANPQPQRQTTTTTFAGGPGVSQSSSSDSAIANTIGQLGGSLISGILGGSDGELAGQIFSGTMSAAASAGEGQDPMSGIFTGLAQQAVGGNTGTASAVGVFGQMMSNGSTAPVAASVSDFGTAMAVAQANGSTAPSGLTQGQCNRILSNQNCVNNRGMIDLQSGRCTQEIINRSPSGQIINLPTGYAFNEHPRPAWMPLPQFGGTIPAQCGVATTVAEYDRRNNRDTAEARGETPNPNTDFSRRVGDPGGSSNGISNTAPTLEGMDNFAFQCSMTNQTHQVPIPATLSGQCRTAMERFTRVFTCNLIDEMEQAQEAYYAQCAGGIFQ